jgi:hypothetical protein
VLQPDPDNAYDIGCAGPARFRDLFSDYTWLLTSYLNDSDGATPTTREGLVRFCKSLPSVRTSIQRHILIETDPDVRADLIAILLEA